MAIDDPLDEQEQSERVRTWLRNNGAGLIGGIALGLVVIFGWQWWQKRQLHDRNEAHARYDTAISSLSAGDLDKARADVASMKADPAYAALTGLRLAKLQVDEGDHNGAIATLRAIQADLVLQPVIDLRLARLLVDADKADEALKLLEGRGDAPALELRGDALAVAQKTEEAREAYTKALTAMDVAAPQRRLVELKLADVGGSVPKTAEPI